MTDDRLAAAISRGVAFDSFVEAAIRERFGESAEHFLSGSPTFDTAPFVELLLSSGCPAERIPRLVAMLNDLKLQDYFLLHEVSPQRNHSTPDPGSPASRLSEAAIDQTYIVMARIFFERLMNLVYYLELGTELSGRSKRRAFFRMVRASERWRWMEGFEALIHRYDEAYRTPEVHSGSVLRGHLERGETGVFWRTMAPQNLVYGLWDEIEAVLGGGTGQPDNVIGRVASDWMGRGTSGARSSVGRRKKPNGAEPCSASASPRFTCDSLRPARIQGPHLTCAR